jgi:hypothetical protein
LDNASSRNDGQLTAASLAMKVAVERLREGASPETDTTEVMTRSMLAYARELHDAGRDSALISFRSNVSLTLHILGQHDARVELGHLSLDAATVLGNDLARAEILIDDLGWGNYMTGHPADALLHIDQGESIARAALDSGSPRANELTMAVAKAFRHRALINADDSRAIEQDGLGIALEMLGQIVTDDEVVAREIGQVYHARALVVAIQHRCDEQGSLDQDDRRAREDISGALGDARRASTIFRELGDQARYTKALFLEVRLLEALGLDLEARQVRAVRDRALAASDWSRPDRVTTLRKV